MNLNPRALKEAAWDLAARRPTLVAGGGRCERGLYDTVTLVKGLRADTNTPLAGLPQDHPLFRGHLALAQKRVAEQLSPYNVVLVLGAPVYLYYPYVPGLVVEEGTRVRQLTEDPEEANRAAVGEAIIGDVGTAILWLVGESPTSQPAPTSRFCPAVYT